MAARPPPPGGFLIRPQRNYVAPRMEAEMVARLTDYGDDYDKLRRMQYRINWMQQNIQTQRRMLDELKALANSNAHQVSEFEITLAELELDLEVDITTREPALRRAVSVNTDILKNWVVNSDFVRDPPSAVLCPSSLEIYAVDVIKTRLGIVWPSHYVFRVGISGNPRSPVYQQLADYAQRLNLPVVHL